MRVFLISLVFILGVNFSWGSEKEDYFALTQSYQDGFYNLTLSSSRAFLRKYPDSEFKEDVDLIKGLSLYRLKKYPQAVEVFTPLAGSKKVRIRDQAYFYLGKLYLLAGEKKKAQENFLFLIQNTQDRKILSGAHYELGLLYFKEGDYKSAIGEWREVLKGEKIPSELKPDIIYNLILAHLKINKLEEAGEFISNYLKDDKPAFYYFSGKVNFYEKAYSKSIEEFEKLIHSDYPLIWKQKAILGEVWSFISLKEFDSAEEALSEIKKFESSEIEEEWYYLKAFLFYKKGEFTPGIRYYQRFISKFKDSDWSERAYLELVDCYYSIGRCSQAIELAQRFFKYYPESPNREQMHYLLGWVYYKEGDIERAIQEFEWVIQNSKDVDLKINSSCRVGDLLSEIGRFDEAIERYNYVLENYPESLYAEYAQYQLGLDLLEKKDYEAAILALRTLVKNFPRSSLLDKVYYHLGLAYFKKGDYALALDETNALIEGYPNSKFKKKALLQKAVLLYNLGRYQEVILLLEGNSQLQDNPYIHFILAKAYIKNKNYKLAEEEYNWLKENLKESELLAYLYFQIGELKFYLKEWDPAYINFQNAYQIAQSEKVKERALYWQAWCYYNKGELDKALAIFKRLQNSPTLEEEARYYSGLILNAQGNTEEAIKILEGFLSSNSRFTRVAKLKLGDIYRDLKEYREALKYYQSLESSPPYDIISAEASFKIAEIYEAQNDIDSALLQYLRLISIFDVQIPYVNKARIRSARLLESKGRIEEARRIYLELSSGEGEEAIYARERLKQLDELNQRR